MRSILLGTFLLPLLISCTGAGHLVWYQPGAGEAQLAGDVEECLAVAQYEPISPIAPRKLSEDYYEEKEREYRACMQRRGWEIVDSGEVAVPWAEESEGRYPTRIWQGVLGN